MQCHDVRDRRPGQPLHYIGPIEAALGGNLMDPSQRKPGRSKQNDTCGDMSCQVVGLANSIQIQCFTKPVRTWKSSTN